MPDVEARIISESLRWLSSLEIPTDNIESHLQRCLGCWAAEVFLGMPPEQMNDQPGDRPLRQLLEMETFEVSDYTGSPILALTIQAGLRVRGLEHRSLTELVEYYAKVVNSANINSVGDVALVQTLLYKAGFDVVTPLHIAKLSEDWRMRAIDDRDELLRMCNMVATSTVWGNREVEVGDLAEILPRLAVSYAMDWDLRAVCEIMRACTYLGLSQQAPVHWAQEWLLDQHNDGRFGLILPECQLSGIDPEDDELFLLPTVRSLWTLGELRHTGFLLHSTGSGQHVDANRQGIVARMEPSLLVTPTRPKSTPADKRDSEPSKFRLRPLSESRLMRNGLKPGTLAPNFCLPSLLGDDEISLSDYRGASVLLVFVDPHCEPCDEVLVQLAAFDKQFQSDKLSVLIICHGDPDANQRKMARHDVEFPVARQNRWAISRLYGTFTFPSAFLINDEGVITHEVAHGPNIINLVSTS